MQHLTVCYMTNRKDCRIEWLFDSLHRELAGNYENIKIVIVDFWCDGSFERMSHIMRNAPANAKVVHVPVKPNVWQGKHRLTKENYFAASNARNTAICLAEDGWIAFVDDLSVLLPGWLEAVRRGMAENYIVLGAYKKVKDLVVDHGNVASFTPFPPGVDSRLNGLDLAKAHHVDGGWMFGCSVAGPVEAFLQINGFDEDCDSLGSEDYIAGIMLEKAGYKLMYDPRMMTYESEELHYLDKPFKRIIKPYSEKSNFKEKDASWAILNMVKFHGRQKAPNYFGEGGIRAVRQQVLAGEPFPITQIPQHDWRDGEPLENM